MVDDILGEAGVEAVFEEDQLGGRMGVFLGWRIHPQETSDFSLDLADCLAAITRWAGSFSFIIQYIVPRLRLGGNPCN